MMSPIDNSAFITSDTDHWQEKDLPKIAGRCPDIANTLDKLTVPDTTFPKKWTAIHRWICFKKMLGFPRTK